MNEFRQAQLAFVRFVALALAIARLHQHAVAIATRRAESGIVMRVLLVVVLGASLSSAAAVEAVSPEPLTLARAIELALSANPEVRSAGLDVQRAQEGVAAARSRYLPVLSLQLQGGGLLVPVEMDIAGGSLGTLPGVGPIPPTKTTLKSSTDFTVSMTSTLVQPLTRLLEVHHNVRMSEAAVASSREELRGERASVVTAVKRAYHAVLSGQGALAAAEEQVETQVELVRTQADLLQQEAALEHEALEARVGLAQARTQLLAIRNGLDTAKEQLNRLLGRDVRTPFTVEDLPDASPAELDLEAARAHALQHRPELRQAREEIERAEAGRSAKRSEYLPDLSLFASYTSYFNVEVLPRNVALVGLQLKWDWDWGRRGHELNDRSATLEQARVKARDVEQAVLVDVGDRWRKLQEARAALEVADLTLAALRAKAPVMESRRRLEAALVKDTLHVRAQVSQAAHDRQRALLSVWETMAEFERALGDAP